MSAVATIPEYIAQFSAEQQVVLNTLYHFIQKIVPKTTTETITYKMPTFRYNGNLFHFAMYKNHIGLYPGAAAIEQFKEAIEKYKSSKGAVQIPVNVNLPFEIIEQMIQYNVSLLKDKKGPNWHESRGDWEAADAFMQELIVKLPLEKTFKWGSDIYTFQGKNVIGWGGFKNFFSLWFYNGVFLEDPYQVLISASEGKTKALRQWRFTDVKDMDERKITQYIKESIQTIKDGKEITPEKSVEVQPEGLFSDWLNANNTVKVAFEKLTKGKRKEYIEYINEAKQEKTKHTRLEKIKPLIINNQGLNDKYKSK